MASPMAVQDVRRAGPNAGRMPALPGGERIAQKQVLLSGGTERVVSEEELALINRFALDPLTADEVFVQEMDLATSWYDIDYQRFSPSVLGDFQRTLPGKSLLLGHQYDSVAEGLWYTANIVEVPQPPRQSAPSPAPHQMLRASWYTVKTSENEHLRQLLRAGVIRYCSITVAARDGGDLTCDICGKSLFGWDCPHILGTDYEGRIATATWQSPCEAWEGSLVYLGAQFGSESRKVAARQAAVAAAMLGGAKGGIECSPEERARFIQAVERLYELVDQKLPDGLREGQAFHEIAWENGEPDVLQEMIWERVLARYPQQLSKEAFTAQRWFTREGRVLSPANRALISSAVSTMSEGQATLQDLLDATDPDREAVIAMEDQLRAALGLPADRDPLEALRLAAAMTTAA